MGHQGVLSRGYQLSADWLRVEELALEHFPSMSWGGLGVCNLAERSHPDCDFVT